MRQQLQRSAAGLRSLSALSLRVAGHWRTHLLAVAAAAAVMAITIVGSLGVGDAIQEGLRRLAQARLGSVAAAVVGPEWFRAELADRFAEKLRDAGVPAAVVPAGLLSATVARPAEDGRGPSRSVAILLGCDRPAELGFRLPPPVVGDGVGLSQGLAAALGLAVGDSVLLRVAEGSAVPADTPLGRRSGRSRSRRMRVTALLPPGSVGDFSLRPAEAAAGVALVSLAVVQDLLSQPARVNAAFVVPETESGGSGYRRPLSLERLEQTLSPTLDDLGLVLADEKESGIRLSSRRLLLEPAVDAAAERVLKPHGGTPSLVFLANDIRPTGGATAAAVPYSTVLGLASAEHPLGKLVDASGETLALPTGDGVIINHWLADDLAAQGHQVAIGDELTITCFAPETLHGQVEEKAYTCRVSGIAAMQGLAVARGVVPTVAGVTDEASIADWDPPFPFDRTRVRDRPPHDEDEQYWQEYGPTPKLFMPLARARQIAGSRFGQTTAWHLPQQAAVQWQSLAHELAAAIPPAAVGLQVLPVANLAALAATGSTPFGLLFLALSSFVIAAGLILLWLLFGLLVTSRLRMLGILAAVGWRPLRLAALLGLVATTAVVGGVTLGMLLGPLWSQVLLRRLGATWTARVAGDTAAAFSGSLPTLTTMVAGASAAVVVAMAAVVGAAFRAGRLPPLRLLRGETVARLPWWLGRRRPLTTLTGLAGRELRRRPSRSLAVVVMVALAEFLIVFVAGFELTMPTAASTRRTPTGGWTHLLRFASPTSVDPTQPAASGELGLTTKQQKLFEHSELALIRASQGDDASCTNLYATTAPVVWGLPQRFLERGGFEFVSHVSLPAGLDNPWCLLSTGATPEAPVPVILDAATAQWALKLGGINSTFRLSPATGGILPPDADQGIECQIVGLLEPGILQGAILMAEAEFTRLFPLVSGYRLALLEAPAAALDEADRPAGSGAMSVDAAVTAAWADAGVAVEPAAARLRRLYAVQNTFLAGFQTLGTLGLMLGTIGLAAVAVQGVIERRGALAVLQAIGFTRRRLARLLWQEMMLQVLVGLGLGAGGGLLASLPFLTGGRLGIPWGWLAVSLGGTLLAATLAGFLAVLWITIPPRPIEQ